MKPGPDRPPRLAQIILRRILTEDEGFDKLGDFEEGFGEIERAEGLGRARSWYVRQAAKALPVFFINSVRGSMMMFNNYLKIAYRNLIKHKGYSLLNIAGLAVGLAVCLMILIFVRYELSYDALHVNKDRIYRIERHFVQPDGSPGLAFATLAPGFVPYLEGEFPEIERIARLLAFNQGGDQIVTVGDKTYRESRFFLADQSLFEIFSLPLLQGDPATAIADPNTVVLSETTARRYFGNENALGKMLKVGTDLFRVNGVMKDMPSNAHFHFDFLGALTTVKAQPGLAGYLYGTQNLSDNVTWVYARLAKGATVASVSAGVPAMLDRVLGTRTDATGVIVQASRGNRLFFRKVTDIHLDSRILAEVEINSDRKYILFFTVIALFILLIAGINFTNLSTARASRRAKEVGLRKVVGGYRRMLAFQFLSESLLVVFISLVLSLVLVGLSLPLFRSLTHRDLKFGVLLEPSSLLVLAAVFLVTAFFSGLYPAAYLSSFKPATILRGELTRGSGGARLRKILVVFQFAVSVVLIVSVGVISGQMRYLRNADLGLDRANIVLLPSNQNFLQRWPEVRESLLRNPVVIEAALSKRAPSGSLLDSPGFTAMVDGQPVRGTFRMPHNRVGFGFFKTYGIRLVAGRDFSTEFPTDATEAYILNETAVRRLGWKNSEEAINQSITVGGRPASGRIIGVVADFNYESLTKAIVPIITYILPSQSNTLSIRVAPGNFQSALEHIQAVWTKFQPGEPFTFDFLETRLNALYRNEERMMKMFGAFSLLAIFIACLGLFGLASYSAEQRTREIGIRKILGAPSSRLVVMFSRQFAMWVAVANLIAWPGAYFLMDKWLKNFAYRTNIGLGTFILAAALSLGIALLTIGGQSIRAALADPASSLRHE